MRTMRTTAMVAALLAASCLAAMAADKPPENPPQKPAEKPALSATVVNKDGSKIELKSFEITAESSGLFGSSSEKLEKLPVKAGDLRLDVPLDKLTKIEIVSAEKKGKEVKDVKLKLTDADGKTLEAMLDNEKKTVWKGTHPFADSEATLDLTTIKEILLQPEKK